MFLKILHDFYKTLFHIFHIMKILLICPQIYSLKTYINKNIYL